MTRSAEAGMNKSVAHKRFIYFFFFFTFALEACDNSAALFFHSLFMLLRGHCRTLQTARAFTGAADYFWIKGQRSATGRKGGGATVEPWERQLNKGKRDRSCSDSSHKSLKNSANLLCLENSMGWGVGGGNKGFSTCVKILAFHHVITILLTINIEN